MSSRGVLLFAVNNSLIDYVRLAEVNAQLIHKHMGTKVSIVTDAAGAADLTGSDVFDRIIVDDTQSPSNMRVYRDTDAHMVRTDFKNSGRPSAYELSPYDETLLIDVDYLIQNDALNAVWGCPDELRINNVALSLLNQPLTGSEDRLNPMGIKMVWATVVYFKKCGFSRTLFELVKHIKEMWSYYKMVYGFPGKMYRNDYAFSIALHILGGHKESNGIASLPIPYILTATDKDQLYAVKDGALQVFVNDANKFYLTKVTGLNLHCMNKVSLMRNIESLEQLSYTDEVS